MRVRVLAVVLSVLQLLPRANCNCAVYGCTPSLSFTCPTDFYDGNFWPDLAVSYEDNHLLPTGAGCVANDDRILCPMSGDGKNLLISWNMLAQFKSWNVSMKSMVRLPAVDTFGQVYATDGYFLIGLDETGKPLGPHIKMEPTSGPLFDVAIVAEKFIYLLYKCGFMVAYFTNGIPYASIWLNETVNGVNGTFIPLTNPAISGERVYIITVFKPSKTSLDINDTILRLFAIDVRTIMVERIKIIWYDEITANTKDIFIPYINDMQTECIDQPAAADFSDVTANVIVEGGIVMVSVNYFNSTISSNGSLLLSISDNGDTYSRNFLNTMLPIFQAAAYASPNFTLSSRCNREVPPPPLPPPSIWVSWIGNDAKSSIEKIDIKTGEAIGKLSIDSLQDMVLTSKISIFYNDQLLHEQQRFKSCDDEFQRTELARMIFGYHSKEIYYLAALDISGEPELIVSEKLPGNAAAIGQVATVGSGRDTMMALTTTKGVYFYVIYAE